METEELTRLDRELPLPQIRLAALPVAGLSPDDVETLAAGLLHRTAAS